MSLQIGESVGSYRIVGHLGQGGMATVYKAHHASLDRYVAVKVLHPAFREDRSFLARFEREARVLAKLEHPNIVPIYDFAEHQGQPYLVMKYIEGETLKARLTRGPISLQETLTIVDAVGSALAFAHRQGVLHRDIKPSNIILSRDGLYYLSDFGLARMASAGESTLSQDTLLGTPNYISPEQAQGQRDLDGRTDIYSFGVVLYEVLVGRVPFSGDTPFSVIHDHIFTPLPPPRAIHPGVSEPLEKFLLTALAKERGDRFADAAAAVAAFHQAAGGPLPGTATRPTVPPAAAPTRAERRPPAAGSTAAQARPSKQTRWLTVGGVLTSVACLGLACLGLLGVVRAQRQNRTQTAVARVTTPAPAFTPSAVTGGETDPAIAAAETAVSARPEEIRPYLELAQAYYGVQRVDEAVEVWAKGAETADYRGDYYLRGPLLFLRDDPITALVVMADGLRHNPSRPMWEMTEPLLLRATSIPEAGPVLQQYVDDFPHDHRPALALSHYHLLMGQPDQALPLIEGLRRDYPDTPAVHMVYGNYLAATGDTAGAVREFEAVLANPQTPADTRLVAQRRLNELKGTPNP